MHRLNRRRWIVVLAAFFLAACSGGAPSTGPTTTPGPTATAPTAPAGQPAPTGPTATLSPVLSPTPSPGASPVGAAPPRPAHTTYKLVKQVTAKDGFTTTSTYRATWSEPAGAATRFTVYGVNECTRYAAAYDNQPCVVQGMQVPADQLEVLATATGTKRSVLVRWTRKDEEGPDPYWAILLSASNQYGESRSAILFSGLVCFECVY